ncbi:hypothetical protein OPQ81_005365 [Rhizoctonia solani]|nr:hypothetical protein OPQ81_005365 [Rhizoctonia solani]
MRGPGADVEDPLLSWIGEQDKNNSKAGVSGMFDDIKGSIKEKCAWDAHGPTQYTEEERRTVFQYMRPKIKHLKVPSHSTATSWRRCGITVKGRATAGTSMWPAKSRTMKATLPTVGSLPAPLHAGPRAQSGGTRLETSISQYGRLEKPISYLRSANARLLRTQSSPRELKYRNRQAQIDEDDGGPLSAACSEYAKTQPSIVWSPRVSKTNSLCPPMKPTLPYDFYNRKIDRMDPELGKALREGVTDTAPSFGAGSTEDVRKFSRSAVESAVEKHWGLDQMNALLADKHKELTFLQYNEEQVNRINEDYRDKIRHLKYENRKLNDCLVLQRNMRDRRILKSVDRHIRSLEYECKAKLAEVKARYRENEQLCNEYEHMQDYQKQLLAVLGKETPGEVFKEFPHVWQSLEVRKNRRNFS